MAKPVMGYWVKAAVVPAAAFLLVACGGGSDGVDEASPELQYPLRVAYKNLIEREGTLSAAVSGSATDGEDTVQFVGSGSMTESATTGSFEGQMAIVKNLTVNGDLIVEGISVPFTNSSKNYFSQSFAPLGTSANGNHCVVRGPFVIPEFVKVGDSGPFAEVDCYSSSSKSIKIGTSVQTYAIEAASNDGARLKIVENVKDTSGGQATSDSVFDISMDGAIRRRSERITFQDSGITFNMRLNYN
ncbi:hypothetical protein [Hydrogenophaga defluvii]|uniref:Lipoprotein n=1 Tax=Hydrogenophaga defluvii TaxID=249410 RepID=A0ABW2SA49_9BURK